MTLIVSAQRSDGIIMLSDVILSQPLGSGTEQVSSPLMHFNFFNKIKLGDTYPNDYVSTAFGQKSVHIGERSFALWAGSTATARSVLKELDIVEIRRTMEPIQSIFERIGLRKTDIEELALILFRDQGNGVYQELIGTESVSRRSGDFIFAGSGAFPIITDPFDEETSNSFEQFIKSFFARVAAATFGEVLTQDNGSFSFGGWFEITQFGNGGFSKIPYAVKFWEIDGDKIAVGPAMMSGYRGRNLLIFPLDYRKAKASLPIRVPDFLGRDDANDANWFVPDQAHRLEFHLLHFLDLEQTFFVVFHHEKLTISVKINNEGITYGENGRQILSLCRQIRESPSNYHEIKYSSRPPK